MNEENLKSIGDRTASEQREITQKGGIASGIARGKKKLFREAMIDILELPANDKMLAMIQKAFSIGKNKQITLKEAMIYAQAIKAIKDKDTQAFNALVDRVDGKPVATTQLTGLDGRDLVPPIINLIPAFPKDCFNKSLLINE